MKKILINNKTKIIFIVLVFLISMINNMVLARYEYYGEIEIADVEINKRKPEIKLISIKSDNNIFENYANKDTKIYIEFLVRGKIEESLRKEDIEIIVGNKKIEKELIKIEKKEQNEETKYIIKIQGVQGEGKLRIIVPAEMFENENGLKNDKTEFETEIIVDNTAPIVSQIREEINENLVRITIRANERILDIEGWNKTENPRIIYKEVKKGEDIILHIIDYARNKNTIEIKT